MGTIIDVLFIITGSVLGLSFGKIFDEKNKENINKICGLILIFISLESFIDSITKIKNASIFITLSLLIGTTIGELIDFDKLLLRFSKWLKRKIKSKDQKFTKAFLTATYSTSIGAMAVVGAMTDGLTGNYSILLTKSIIDGIIVFGLSSSLGSGVIFSFIPVMIFQGIIYFTAFFLKDFITFKCISMLSITGSILIFAVGINLIFGKKFSVANMLPSLLIALALSFIM